MGKSFLGEPEKDGTLRRKRITELIEEYNGQLEQDPKRIQFRAINDDTGMEDIIAYNDICEFIQDQEQNEDGTWKYRNILNHRTVRRQHQILLEW